MPAFFVHSTSQLTVQLNTSSKKVKMFKIVLLSCATVALVLAYPQAAGEPGAAGAAGAPGAPGAPGAAAVQVVKQDSEVDVNGYNFEFETSDGTQRQEQGEYRNDTDQQGLLVKGSYSYVAPDGQHIHVTFLADKNGYQPQQYVGDDAPPQQN